MTRPIDDYVDQLTWRLPLASRRLLRETRAHLEEARDRLIAEGVPAEEAEREAIASFGDVGDIVDAVGRDGGPLLSPKLAAWVPWLAAVLVLPTLVFIGANVIESLAGNQGGSGVFGGALDRWRQPTNLLLSLGPPVAFALVILSGVRVRLGRAQRGVHVVIQVHLSRALVAIGVLSAVLTVAVVAYLLTENVFCAPVGTWAIC